MEKEEILEAITREDYPNGKEFGGIVYYAKVLDLDKLADFLSKHLTPPKDI